MSDGGGLLRQECQSVAQLLRPVDLAVEPGSPRGAESFADSRTGRDAPRQQVGPAQAELQAAQLREVAPDPGAAPLVAVRHEQEQLLAAQRLQRLDDLMGVRLS